LERALRSSGKLRIVTLDLERVDVAVRGDITRLPFPSASFDGVICSHVLEHIPDDAGAMRELRRVLRPGGTILIQVPQSGKQHTYEDWSITSAEERIKHFGQEDHVRWYGEDLVDRLRVAGLKVAIESPIEYRQVYGFKDERIYRCQSQ
jgi:ubiquinone/menaquinone biosynthesis C-methylase UbiE